MFKNIKALFFDLDDTLINFGGVTHQVWQLACTSLCNERPGLIDADVLANKINKINDAFWADEKRRPKGNTDFKKVRKDILKAAFLELHLDDKSALNYLLERYPLYKEQAVYLYDDVPKTLAQLKLLNYQLVLITNGDGQRQREKITRFNLTQYFDYILIEGELGFGKPEIQVYQKALDLCHINPQEACMIGDNYLWEVETPIRFGMQGIWVNRNNQKVISDQIKPSAIISNISELLNL